LFEKFAVNMRFMSLSSINIESFCPIDWLMDSYHWSSGGDTTPYGGGYFAACQDCRSTSRVSAMACFTKWRCSQQPSPNATACLNASASPKPPRITMADPKALCARPRFFRGDPAAPVRMLTEGTRTRPLPSSRPVAPPEPADAAHLAAPVRRRGARRPRHAARNSRKRCEPEKVPEKCVSLRIASSPSPPFIMIRHGKPRAQRGARKPRAQRGGRSAQCGLCRDRFELRDKPDEGQCGCDSDLMGSVQALLPTMNRLGVRSLTRRCIPWQEQ
jgi:hypothetical protein